MIRSRIAAVCVLLLAFTALPGCTKVEDKVFDGFIAAERAMAGVEKMQITVDDIEWVYLKNAWQPERETVVLLHGFSADKDNWTRFAGELGDHYNLLIPDLPGHGETTRSMDLRYDIDTQARRVLSLAEALGIEKFHLAGNSMGGAIAVRTSWLGPARVATLGLFNAAGAKAKESEFDASLRAGINPLIVKKPEDFETVIAWAMAEPPFLPWPVARVKGRQGILNAALNEKIFADLSRDNDIDQTRILGEVVARTLVVWGDKDRLLDVANADMFVSSMPLAQKVIMPGIGHAPMLEAPAESAQAYREFLAAK
jgi:abhydrolase domain-containing protein 6